MNMTFRWYGRGNDTITLEQIKQIPATKGIVWSLHNKAAGEAWSKEEIQAEVDYIQQHGFHIDVVESVNVHEAIKLGLPERDQYIENYKTTLQNLGEVGVKVVCYNFMPIFDWTRTDLFHPLDDGSTALYFDKTKIMSLQPKQLIETVRDSSQLILPGWEPERLSRIDELFSQYEHVTEEQLWDNLAYFLMAVLPTAEIANIKLAIHPDDPPYSIFNLPRIITGADSYERLIDISDSPSNCFTYCSGSMGANPQNNMVAIAEKYLERVPFAHLRNIKIYEDGSFIETSHYTTDGSIDLASIVQVMVDNHFTGYVRPDHGRHLWDEQCRPGYGLYDRALGIMYIHGLWDAFTKNREVKGE